MFPEGLNLPEYTNRLERDSVIGIATCYELDGPGIESRLGRVFPHPFTPILGPTKRPLQWAPCRTSPSLFSGGRIA